MIKQSRSFSLIEIIIAVALGIVLIGSSYELYYLAAKTLYKSNTHFEIRQNARIALERMSRDLRQSEEIISSLPINETDPPVSSVKFQDGHETTKIQYIEFYLNENKLYKKYSHYSFSYSTDQWVYWDTKDNGGLSPSESVDSDQLIAENMSELKFWGRTIINISLISQKGELKEVFKTTVLGRNIL